MASGLHYQDLWHKTVWRFNDEREEKNKSQFSKVVLIDLEVKFRLIQSMKVACHIWTRFRSISCVHYHEECVQKRRKWHESTIINKKREGAISEMVKTIHTIFSTAMYAWCIFWITHLCNWVCWLKGEGGMTYLKTDLHEGLWNILCKSVTAHTQIYKTFYKRKSSNLSKPDAWWDGVQSGRADSKTK